MKLLAQPTYRAVLFAAALGLALSAAGAAKAFTFEDQGVAGGGRGFTDLDIPKVPNAGVPDSRFTSSNGLTTFKSGNGTFQFGARPSFDQRFNSDNLFDPYYRDGR